MRELDISDQELPALADETLNLAKSYWSRLDGRPAYPATSGEETARLFSRAWAETGRGRGILADFQQIADHSRPSGARFFGYVVGSGEPVGALGEWLAAVLNQNVTSWRSAPAATTIERTVVGWLADAVGCPGFMAACAVAVRRPISWPWRWRGRRSSPPTKQVPAPAWCTPPSRRTCPSPKPSRCWGLAGRIFG